MIENNNPNNIKYPFTNGKSFSRKINRGVPGDKFSFIAKCPTIVDSIKVLAFPRGDGNTGMFLNKKGMPPKRDVYDTHLRVYYPWQSYFDFLDKSVIYMDEGDEITLGCIRSSSASISYREMPNQDTVLGSITDTIVDPKNPQSYPYVIRKSLSGRANKDKIFTAQGRVTIDSILAGARDIHTVSLYIGFHINGDEQNQREVNLTSSIYATSQKLKKFNDEHSIQLKGVRELLSGGEVQLQKGEYIKFNTSDRGTVDYILSYRELLVSTDQVIPK